jgi:hypothetical protein
VIFIESKAFTRRLQQLARDDSDEVLSLIQKDLLDKPNRGDMPKKLGGIRKDRIANPGRGKGKRGGFRYMYIYLEAKHHIHLLFLLDKGDQEDLTAEQQKEIRALVAQLKATGGK